MSNLIDTHQVDHVKGFLYYFFKFRYTTLINLLIKRFFKHDRNPTHVPSNVENVNDDVPFILLLINVAPSPSMYP